MNPVDLPQEFLDQLDRVTGRRSRIVVEHMASCLIDIYISEPVFGCNFCVHCLRATTEPNPGWGFQDLAV